MMRRILANLIGVGSVGPVDDGGTTQTMQVTEGAAGSGFGDRVIDKVLRIAEFGFSSNPPTGSQVLMIRRGGDRSCSIIIGTSHLPSRPTGLQPGETSFYNNFEMSITLTENGPVIDCGGKPIIIQNTSGMHVEGPITSDDDITALNSSQPLAMSTIRSTFDTHTHPISGANTLKPAQSI